MFAILSPIGSQKKLNCPHPRQCQEPKRGMDQVDLGRWPAGRSKPSYRPDEVEQQKLLPYFKQLGAILSKLKTSVSEQKFTT